MDLLDFWSLTKKHPWLPRIFVHFWIRIENKEEIWPHSITEYFSPEALEAVSIFIKDWGELDLTETPVDKSGHGKSPEGRWTEELSMCHDVYWHDPTTDSWPLTRHLVNDTKETCGKLPTTERMIEHVEALGGVVDVVVRTTYCQRQDLSLDKLEALRQGLFDDDAAHCTTTYEVYIHPNFKP